MEKTTATGFSFFAFIALTLPFVFLGFAALVRSGLSLRGMGEQVSTIRQESFKAVRLRLRLAVPGSAPRLLLPAHHRDFFEEPQRVRYIVCFQPFAPCGLFATDF